MAKPPGAGENERTAAGFRPAISQGASEKMGKRRKKDSEDIIMPDEARRQELAERFRGHFEAIKEAEDAMSDSVRGMVEAYLAGADAAERRAALSAITGILRQSEVYPYVKECIIAWLTKLGFILSEGRFVGLPDDRLLRVLLARIGKPLDEDPENPDSNWLEDEDEPEDPGDAPGRSPEVILRALTEMLRSHERALELEEDEGSRERIKKMILMVEHMIVKFRDKGELP